MEKIYIAGAHSRGITMGHYLTYLDPSIKILAYLYDNDEENPKEVNKVPVIKIDKNSQLDTECTVYIGTRGANFESITNTLTKCGMKKIIPVDPKLDLDIRNAYLKKYYQSVGREYLKIDDFTAKESCTGNQLKERIYVAGSAFDRPLQEKYILADYEKLIQVGTALSEKRLDTDIFDNVGENISNRNSQFCELTGLYWMWKNASEDIVGLSHYRRHFILPNDWKARMIDNDVDVILPLPLYVGPSIGENYENRHDAAIWKTMLEYMKERSPVDYEAACKFFYETSLYSPCNMFIMKREILNDLCEFIFPLVIATADKCKTLEDRYQNRYPGFMSERLITFFFEKNRDKYRVVYADKNFLP